MKVILREDVPKVGRRHEVKEVANGYARNYLVPNQLAYIASEANKKAIETTQRHQEEKKAERDTQLARDLQKLTGKTITFKEKASESGSLFAGVDKEKIAAKLREEEAVELDAEHLELEKPIKELGDHTVTVVAGEKSTEITIKVEAADEQK